MGMGHVPKDPVHSFGEGVEFQRRERGGIALPGHHHSGKSLAKARLARARWAEDRVARWYHDNNFEIIARNWTMRGGELDVVARRRHLIVVCEVKARANDAFGSALEAITEQKILRVRRAGFSFLRQLEESGLQIRFDIATVTGVELVMYHDAF